MNLQNRNKKVVRVAAFLAASGLLTACGQDSNTNYTLHYTTYSNATSDQSKTVQRWAKEVEKLTNGGVQVEFHYSQSLAGADEALQATLDGRADLAQVGSFYASSDLSMFTVIELPFETQNPEVHMTAIERLYRENEVYRKDFDQQGVKLLYPLPLGSVVLGLKQPAKAPEDLASRSIRSGGLTSEVLMSAGVNPVAMTATDIYESMERGIVDGYSALAVANLSTFGLTRVTPYLVNPGIGAYSSSIVVINAKLFESMPDEYKKAIEKASSHGISIGLEEMDAAASLACTELKQEGTELTEFSVEDVMAWKQQVNVDSDWVSRYSKQGYDAQSVLDDYRKIIADEETTSTYSDPVITCMGG
ncbi:C4-dicarboxylate TRAP transporter substrate-binding protein [Neptunomonas sp.]|uniref:C4-dicarboxylate TRAP transporter substrate-binding protein n=1 Tax=Neptunomonas sp. TaxID=1971898 RepID=UPI003564802F